MNYTEDILAQLHEQGKQGLYKKKPTWPKKLGLELRRYENETHKKEVDRVVH